MSEKDLPSLTRKEDLLASSKSASERILENPFLNAAAHTLVQGPVDAIAQVVDKTTGSNFLPNVRLVPDAQKTEFGSFDWVQQQVGGAVGALPYLVALHQGSRSMLAGSMLSADTKLMLAAGVKLGSSGMNQLARLELASAGITGLVYGAGLTPVKASEAGSLDTLLTAKLRNGVVGAGTFMTLTGTMMGTKSLAESLQPGLLRTVVGSNVGAGIIGGLPAGMFSAQADSILSGKGPASLKDSLEAMTGFVLIGGLMPGGQKVFKTVSERLAGPGGKASEVTSTNSLTARDAAELANPGNAPRVKPIERVFSAEEMARITQWKEAQAVLEETKFRDHQPQRIRDLADEAYGGGAPIKGRKLHILLGNCGAGKSRITEALAQELGAMTPDSDHIKVKIPGYREGLGNQAVHEDSSAAYKILLDRALQNGDNIVWQGVGKTQKGVIDLMQQAKDHGYEVVMHMIDAPPEVAAMRVYNRANKGPDANGIRQMIPPEVPLKPAYQYVPRLNFFKMIGESAQSAQSGGPKMIDGFRLWRSTSEAHSAFNPTMGTVPNLRPSWMLQFAELDQQQDGKNLQSVKEKIATP